MQTGTKTLSVWNPGTQTFETIEVTNEVYNYYRRSKWNLEDQEKKINRFETPFSGLKGGENGAYENFKEFISEGCDPESQYFKEDIIRLLIKTVSELEEADRLLLEALYRMEKTEKQYAEEIGVSQPAIHKKKKRILQVLYKALKEKGYTFRA